MLDTVHQCTQQEGALAVRAEPPLLRVDTSEPFGMEEHLFQRGLS